MNTKLPAREIAICKRLRELRLSLHLDQENFAGAVEISRVRLASYEHLRAPLRYELASWICHRFDVNQRWLATGREPKFHCVPVVSRVIDLIKPRELFSSAYDRVMAPGLEKYLVELAEKLACSVSAIDPDDARFSSIGTVGEITHDVLMVYLVRLIGSSAACIPSHLLSDYYRVMAAANGKFWRAHGLSASANKLPKPIKTK